MDDLPPPPTHCRNGHPLGPRLVHLTWTFCSCRQPDHNGHTVYYCEHVIDGNRCGDKQVRGCVKASGAPRG
jgi:hypothetical protein